MNSPATPKSLLDWAYLVFDVGFQVSVLLFVAGGMAPAFISIFRGWAPRKARSEEQGVWTTKSVLGQLLCVVVFSAVYGLVNQLGGYLLHLIPGLALGLILTKHFEGKQTESASLVGLFESATGIPFDATIAQKMVKEQIAKPTSKSRGEKKPEEPHDDR